MASRAAPERPFILVLAGVNGAGKSSVGGALLADQGLTWFNPDSHARDLMTQLGLNQNEANARAWEYGRLQLETAMANSTNHAFETTLGGRTISGMLARATRTHEVVMLFCGLASPEQHIERVRFRVAHGGHGIPEAKIRERWVGSRTNLIKLLPQLAHLQVFDNSVDTAPGEHIPNPVLILEMIDGKMVFPEPGDTTALTDTPEWARPIVQAAIESQSNG